MLTNGLVEGRPDYNEKKAEELRRRALYPTLAELLDNTVAYAQRERKKLKAELKKEH